jgi:hypothetical protein
MRVEIQHQPLGQVAIDKCNMEAPHAMVYDKFKATALVWKSMKKSRKAAKQQSKQNKAG